MYSGPMQNEREVGQPDLAADHPIALFSRVWRALKGARPLPCRADFHPRLVASALPFIIILERRAEPEPQYRYRLVGSEMQLMLGHNPTGQSLADILSPDALKRRLRAYEGAFAQRQPVYLEGAVPVADRDFLPIISGYFPFAAEPFKQLFVLAAPTDWDRHELTGLY